MNLVRQDSAYDSDEKQLPILSTVLGVAKNTVLDKDIAIVPPIIAAV